MAIPKYNELYRPFLDCLSDGTCHSFTEIRTFLADKLKVSEAEQKVMLPSGTQTIFSNRIGWSSTYLKKAGLIETSSRGVYLLTDAGKQVLAENPPCIDNRYLTRFPSFREFIGRSSSVSVSSEANQTPQDILDNAYQQINDTLADTLLAEITKQSSAFFEHLVVQLLQKMGYGGSIAQAGVVLGKSGDEGIDGIIREDKLGFSLIYIQAKRWDCSKAIGRPEIQKFVGALAGQGAAKGLFITTAQFTKEACAYAEKQHTTKVVLVDGAMLSRLMIEHNLGVSTETVYEIKQLDTDFFNESAELSF